MYCFFDDNYLKEGISIFTACMNRSENLNRVLPTWLQHKEVNEIVILDWNSDDSLIDLIDSFNDERIVLAETKSYDKWILTKAYNLAASLTSYKKILKVDSDVEIKKNFFRKHKLDYGYFFAGNWKNGRNLNERHLNGINYLFRKDFYLVNGYNEFITTYGWDDDDLYNRLVSSNLSRKDIDLDYLYHIPHQDRFANQIDNPVSNQSVDIVRCDIEISKNRILISYLSDKYKEAFNDKYKLKKIKKNRYLCEIVDKINIDNLKEVKEFTLKAQRKATKQFLWSFKDYVSISNLKNFQNNINILDEVYTVFFNNKTSPIDELLAEIYHENKKNSKKKNKGRIKSFKKFISLFNINKKAKL
jgi:hypothetical protein